MPELRIDPIVGRRVYIAEDRAGRPSDFVSLKGRNETGAQTPSLAAEAACPFCAGNEAATPHELATACDERGDWQVRVVPNKYPALTLAPDAGDALGAHEVIIESPRHLDELTDLEPAQLATVLRVYRDRLLHWAADGRMRHGLVFKNSGLTAGASLRHIHSQLVATPFVPETVQRELDAAGSFHEARGGCIFCELLESECTAGDRIVCSEDGFVAMCAYAGRQPLETWILPERHQQRFDHADDDQLHKLAGVLLRVLRALGAVVPGAAYNLILHSGPFDDHAAEAYHWHWEVVPRVAYLAGIELGAGVFINPVSPERAAQRLRDADRAAR